MTENKTELLPEMIRYGVGNRQMNEWPNGDYVTVHDVYKIIDFITDNDDRDLMLSRLETMKGALK